MTKEELAQRLDGREYREEMTGEEEKLAKESNLLVLFGASDDLVELRGAIYDEVGAYDGTMIYIGKHGKLLLPIDEDDTEILEKYDVFEKVREDRKNAIQVEALWCSDDIYSWVLTTTHPHEAFDIVEDDTMYCRGIVIDLSIK